MLASKSLMAISHAVPIPTIADTFSVPPFHPSSTKSITSEVQQKKTREKKKKRIRKMIKTSKTAFLFGPKDVRANIDALADVGGADALGTIELVGGKVEKVDA